jgi:hypothetical protein
MKIFIKPGFDMQHKAPKNQHFFPGMAKAAGAGFLIFFKKTI